MKISRGTIHPIPSDLKNILSTDSTMLKAWESISPLARNEWICWITSVKKPETRAHHLKRAQHEMKHGKRRPCCWVGCIHRTDKAMSATQKWVTKRT